MPTDRRGWSNEERELDRELSRRMWGGVAKRLAMALIFALLVLGVEEAPAAPFTPSLERAYNVATHYWGGEPSGCTSIEKAIVPTLDGYYAEASQPEPGERIPCFLWVSRSLASPRAFGTACGVLVHEVGHLRGYGHSDDPTNVMFPDLVRLPEICWRAIEWRMNHGESRPNP